MKLNYFFVLLACSLFGTSYAQEEKFTVEKMWSLHRISGTLPSPNEKWFVYDETTYDYTQNTGTTIVKLYNLSDNSTRVLPIQNAWSFCWTPENELAYLTGKGESTILEKFNPLNDTKTEFHNFGSSEVDGFILSPDGKRIAALEALKNKTTIAETYPDLPKANARLEDNLMYRHWNRWTGNTILHLYWYDKSVANSKRVDVMFGENYPSVTSPFGGIESVCFSKDGNTIFYSTKKKAGKDFALSTNSEIYAFDTRNAITTTLSSAHKGYDTNPRVNFSGQSLAWLSMEKDGNEADKNRLRVMELSSRKEKELTLNLDLSINDFSWHPTKDIIYFTATIKATKQLYSVDVTTGKIVQLTKDVCDYNHFVPMKEKILVERQSMIEPTDIWCYTSKTAAIVQLTNSNKKELANCAKPTVKEKWYTTTDGKKMLTWVIYPPNFDPSKKYPTLLYCQGGPQSPVSQFFSYRWNFRLMASEGYIIVAPNRRGLPGFGQEWNDAISKDWGGQAMNDYLVAIDSSVAQEPAIDKDKLGAVGASYGGYSVYYLAGIHNNRFKTFVAHCGLFNLESWYGTTEELFFANSDIGGPYWLPENKELYAKNSPHKLVQNWNTPMMVIQGGKDFRVPESEGMQAFQVLQLKNIPSKYLLFPEEGHWITKPQNSILWYREYFLWLNSYLK